MRRFRMVAVAFPIVTAYGSWVRTNKTEGFNRIAAWYQCEQNRQRRGRE